MITRTLTIYFRPLSFLFFLVMGCGYGFQNSKNPLYLKEGIQKVYVEPVINNTYKAGVENIVYNNLIQTLISHRRITLVRSPNHADAVLGGVVQSASFSGSSSSSVGGLNPQGFAGDQGLFAKDYIISTEYMAVLNCEFTLNRAVDRPGKVKKVWSSKFSRTKLFPAANQLDVPGTTSALINESEFERALYDLSRSMMDDVHEAMLAMF